MRKYILRLPEDNSEKVVTEIEKFWTLRDRFKEFGLTYKRGIFLYGPPGSGKSCVIQLCCADVIEKFGGIVIRYNSADNIREGLRILRKIEPIKPVILVMEDMEELIAHEHESAILNILDGGEFVDNIVFLATSNHPERLGSRIVNRPSRFDKRFEIGVPCAESRKMFLNHLKEGKTVDLDINKWVEETEGFSMAHLKELFITVNLFETPYEKALKNLDEMHCQIKEIPEFYEGGSDVSSVLRGESSGGRMARRLRA